MLLKMLQCVLFVKVSSTPDSVKKHGLDVLFVFYYHISKSKNLRNKHKLNLDNDRLSENAIAKSSRSQLFHKISVLKNFAKFTGELFCSSFFSIKLRALKPA